jgi:hypothetical protein
MLYVPNIVPTTNTVNSLAILLMLMFQIQKQFSGTLKSFKKQVHFWTGRKHRRHMQTEAKLIKLVLGLHCYAGLQKTHICMRVRHLWFMKSLIQIMKEE